MKPKRPNLRWKGSTAFYDHGGKPRKWERLGTDERVVLDRWQRIHESAKPEHGTCDKMVADYLEHPRAPLAKGTVSNYRTFRGHLSAVFGPLEPHTITQRHIIRYLRDCPRKTARGEIALFSLSFAYWIEQDRLDFNPCFGVRIKLPASRRLRHLMPDEIDRIIGQSEERLAVAIEIAYALGLRISDVCALRWSQLADVVPTQKTGARMRYTVTDDIKPLLDRCKALQARVASLYVLCQRGGKPWNDGSLRNRWNAACKRAGVEDAHFHDLRAAGGTEVDRQGGIRAAQIFLGHRSHRTTEVYLRDKRANVVTPLKRKA